MRLRYYSRVHESCACTNRTIRPNDWRSRRVTVDFTILMASFRPSAIGWCAAEPPCDGLFLLGQRRLPLVTTSSRQWYAYQRDPCSTDAVLHSPVLASSLMVFTGRAVRRGVICICAGATVVPYCAAVLLYVSSVISSSWGAKLGRAPFAGATCKQLPAGRCVVNFNFSRRPRPTRPQT